MVHPGAPKAALEIRGKLQNHFHHACSTCGDQTPAAALGLGPALCDHVLAMFRQFSRYLGVKQVNHFK